MSMSLVGSAIDRVFWRYWSRHRSHFLVIVVLVSLGVASAAAIDLAIEASKESFTSSLQTLWGRATHRIYSRQGIPEDFFVQLRAQFPECRFFPMVQGRVVLVDRQGQRLSARLIGVDGLDLSQFLNLSVKGSTSAQLLGPDAVIASSQLLARLPAGVIRSQERPGISLTVLGEFDGSSAQEDWLVVDISTAQEMLDSRGRLTSVALELTSGEDTMTIERLTRSMEQASQKNATTLELQSSGSQSTASLSLANSLFLNLKALSGLSSLVGAFLVYQAYHFCFLVLRTPFSQLRRLGVTRNELVAAVFWQTTAIGLLGSLLGCLLGVALSKLIVGSLARTLSDLYFQVEVSRLPLSIWTLAKATGLGLLISWGSLVPHWWRMYRLQPAQFGSESLNEKMARGLLDRMLLVGLVCSLLGLLILSLELQLIFHLLGLALLILGCAALTPVVVKKFSGWAHSLVAGKLPWHLRLGWRAVHDKIELSAFPLAALSVALSAVISIETMVSSFRNTLDEWLLLTLRSDVYIALFDDQAQRDGAALPMAFLRSQSFLDSTLDHSVLGVRTTTVPLALDGQTEKSGVLIAHGPLLGATNVEENLKGYRFLEKDSALLRRFADPNAPTICVSEPFATRNRCRVGQTLSCRLSGVRQNFIIAGIFVDFTTDAGYMLMDSGIYRQRSGDFGWSALAVELPKVSAGSPQDKGAMTETLCEKLRRAPGAQALDIHSNRQLRELSQTIFERTFVITGALRWIALLISMAGMAAALTLLYLQQKREWSLLRSLGMTLNEGQSMRTINSIMLGFWTGLASIPLGLLQAFVMVSVIQKTAFGWSLAFGIPSVVLWTPVAACACCALASRFADYCYHRADLPLSIIGSDDA